jgi:hypothetical protein
MPDAIKKLREPAALAAVAFVGLSLLGLLIGLLIPQSVDGVSTSTFGERSYNSDSQFLGIGIAAGVAFAVYLANHVSEGPLGKAKLITLIALIEGAVATLFGLVTLFAAFSADTGSGTASFANFLTGLGGLAALLVALWYTWLTWKTHAPALAPAAVPQPWAGGYATQQGPYGQPPQGQYPGQPQPGYLGQSLTQQPGQPQTPPPGGFGWTPQQQAPSAEHTQVLPPVPGGPQPGFAPAPQPWNPAAPSGAPQLNPGQSGALPPQQQQPPAQPQPGQPQQPQQGSGPFSVGDWRSDS